MQRQATIGRRIGVLGVFNRVVEATIPSDNLVALDPDRFRIGAFCWNQAPEDVPRTVRDRVAVHLRAERSGKLYSIWRLARTLRDLEPAVVHVHHLPSAVWAFRVSRLLPTARRVVTVHGLFHTYSDGQRAKFRKIFSRAAVVVCNSEATRSSIQAILPDTALESKLKVIYNGVDVEAVQELAQHEQRRQNATFEVGCVARFVPQKDHATLLRGFAMFCRKVEDSRLVLLGDGPLRADLERLAHKLGIAASVDFRGMVPRREVYRALGSFSVVAVSSLSEGFCNAMVEPMAAGVPVVVTGIPTLQEVLGPGGQFFEPGQPDELAERLHELHTSPSHATRYGLKLARRAEDRFSLRRCVKEHEGLYTELAQTPARGVV